MGSLKKTVKKALKLSPTNLITRDLIPDRRQATQVQEIEEEQAAIAAPDPEEVMRARERATRRRRGRGIRSNILGGSSTTLG